MKKNSVLMFALLVITLSLGIACQVLKSTEIATADKPAANIVATNSETVKNIEEKPKTEKKTGIISLDDKTDFSVTAEELVNAKKKMSSPIEVPEKYQSKIIEVTGRVARVYTEKEESLAARVYLKGGPRMIFDEVMCKFDEENKAEIKSLKKDQMVTLKGLSDEYWGVVPTFVHCIVIEAK